MRIYKDVDTFVVISHLGIDPSTQETWRGDYLVKQLSQNPQLKNVLQSLMVIHIPYFKMVKFITMMH